MTLPASRTPNPFPESQRVIPVTSAVGFGSNILSAFDDALLGAGAANFNLVRLSSVIPAGTVVEVSSAALQVDGDWGDRLYCVYAAETAAKPGMEAWAGVGWRQVTDGSMRGVFVEHEARSKEELITLITDSLTELAVRRDETFGPIEMEIVGATCKDVPVCALVLAGYEASSWSEIKK